MQGWMVGRLLCRGWLALVGSDWHARPPTRCSHVYIICIQAPQQQATSGGQVVDVPSPGRDVLIMCGGVQQGPGEEGAAGGADHGCVYTLCCVAAGIVLSSYGHRMDVCM